MLAASRSLLELSQLGALIVFGLGLLVVIAVVFAVGSSLRQQLHALRREVDRLRRGLGIPED